MQRIAALATWLGLCVPGVAAAESFECLIEPHLVVSLSSAVPGVIERVEVARGDRVKKGQVIVRLRSGVERAALELAKARAEFGERTRARNAELVAKKLISPFELDQVETEALLAKLELRQAREKLALRTIRSTITGVVVDVAATPGEYVHEQEIVKLAQIDPLNVEVIVPVGSIGDLAPGATATVYPQPPYDTPVEAKVVIVDRVVDAATGTVGVRLELPNPEAALPAGLQCRVDL